MVKRRILTVCLGLVPAGVFLATILTTSSCAEAQQAVPLHVVRVGYGDVAGLKNAIQLSVDACRVAKNLPASSAGLPPDSYLAKLDVIQEEEFFDGQMWAKYSTQKQVGADGSNGCSLALFTARHVDVERVCESRIVGGTALLAELMDFESPSSTPPEIFQDPLSSTQCREKPKTYNLAGLPREDAGAAKCAWNSQIVAKGMAAIGMKANPVGPGFDVCLYEAQPMYSFQGVGHAVVLKTRTVEDAAGNLQNSILGATKAWGNMQLKLFTTGVALDKAKFGRPAVDAFLNLPSKTFL